jgi:hypothetical protein
VPVGSDGLLFLPYLMGERTPHLDSQARGMWFGLTASHTRGHMIRSILEGVAFSLRDSLEIFKELQIPVEQIRASGGGSRSALWRQIQADIYGKELVTLYESEGSAFGAALLAGVRAIPVSVAASGTGHPFANTYRPGPHIPGPMSGATGCIGNNPAVRSLAHSLAELGKKLLTRRSRRCGYSNLRMIHHSAAPWFRRRGKQA